MGSTAFHQAQSLAEIAGYHNDATDSLAFYLRILLQRGDPRFVGEKASAFGELLADRIAETELRSSRAILGTLEASLRIDFRLRIARRAKDPLSRAFRVLQKSTARARFDEDVLGLWKEHHPELKQLVSELRAALKFRHWLAHGRYWERPSNGRFDYVSIYDLAVATLFHFPLFRPE
jgi:hypothetical protein